MAKFNVTDHGNGNYTVEEDSELSIGGLLIGFAALIVFALIGGGIVMGGFAISNAKEARDYEKVLEQKAIETSIWNLDVVECNALRSGALWADPKEIRPDDEKVDFCSWTDYSGLREAYAIINVSNMFEYSRLTGEIHTREEQDESFAIVFRIYADGECIYDSGKMYRSSGTQYFDVDIRGVDIIRFSAVSDDYNASVNPGVILTNAVVHSK